MAWVCSPELSRAFYKRSILQDIGSLFGKMVKIDLQIDTGARGQFVRFAVQVNLVDPLVSKI